MCDISIIVPMYNVSNYLDKSFTSLIGQSKRDGVEYIFVDDCSTDDSLVKLHKLIEEAQLDLSTYKIIEHSENKGSASTRNSGLASCKGKYVGWLDADDWIEPEMFEALYNEAEAYQLDLVSCNYYLNFETEERKITHKNRDKENFMLALLQGDVQGMLWNKLFRRSVIVDHCIRFLDGFNMAEDRNFLFKFLFFTKHIGHIPQTYYHYVQTSDSAMTRNYSIKRIEDEIANDGDICLFIDFHSLGFIPKQVVINFLFQAKKRLLFSDNTTDIKRWRSVFPETNTTENIKTLFIHHKIIALLAIKRRWGMLQLILFIKKILNEYNSNCILF